MTRTGIIFISAILCLIAGCRKPAARIPMQPDPAPTELYRLDNGEFDLVVSTATGRIVRYGPTGGPNLLWENPGANGARSQFPGWKNYGGDKVWIWPEEHWVDSGGPPPGDPASFQVEKNGLHLKLISAVIPGFGVRIVRGITLESKGSHVTIESRFERISPPEHPGPLAVWVVTQTRAADRILARLTPDAAPPGHGRFRSNPWPDVTVSDGIVTLKRSTDRWAKIGLDADALAVPVGNFLFLSRIQDHTPGTYQPFHRAQVYSDSDDSEFRPDGVLPYLEVEFTSPVKMLAVGESVSLTLVWEIHPIKPGEAINPFRK